jgi:hypothetical protein
MAALSVQISEKEADELMIAMGATRAPAYITRDALERQQGESCKLRA